MRAYFAGALALGLTFAMGVQTADAGRNSRAYRSADSCRPYNGPFGFYGNIWCQPSQESYMRNLGAQWPQKTPRSLRNPPRAQYGSYYDY